MRTAEKITVQPRALTINLSRRCVQFAKNIFGHGHCDLAVAGENNIRPGTADTRAFVEVCGTDQNASFRVQHPRHADDANWGQSTDVVYQFCRQSAHATLVMPTHGKFVGASGHPLTEREKKPGECFGLNWVIPLANEKRGIRYMLYDTNYWKSFVHSRLAVAMGNPGCLSLFGATPDLHRLFAEHLRAEYRVRWPGPAVSWINGRFAPSTATTTGSTASSPAP